MSYYSTLKTLPDPEPGYNLEWDQRVTRTAFPTKDNLPKITIVTPSYNQGRFIEQTIRCILLQGYPNLEYIIIDGGSTDNSLEIIKKYEPWLSHWVSEPDSGMYDAINKGFAASTGEIMGWSPTGDLYEPGALNIIGQVFRQQPQIEWLTSLYKVKCDEAGTETARYQIDGFCREAFMKGMNFLGGNPYARYMIQQQSTFWKRSLWKRSGGGMDDSMKGAGDFELWARFFSHNACLFAVDQPVGIFMSHSGQESVTNAERMLEEQTGAFKRVGGKHMGCIEFFLRCYILRHRPFSCLNYASPWRFQADVIHWYQESTTAHLRKRFFC